MPRTMGTHDDEAGSSRSKRSRQHETVEEVLLPQVHHEFLLWEGCNRDAKSRYNTRLAQLLPRHIYLPCGDVLNRMGCDGEIDDMLRIRLREAGSDEEIFTSVAWIRAFNINEPIYAFMQSFCHGFILASMNLTKFEYQLMKLELEEENGFNVHFEGTPKWVYGEMFDLLIARWRLNRKELTLKRKGQICHVAFILKNALKMQGVYRGAYNPPGYAQC
ncbi:hypothetical protein Tco_1162848 [Tanacetum coccineum]